MTDTINRDDGIGHRHAGGPGRPRRPNRSSRRGGRGIRDLFDPHRLHRAMARRGVRAAILAMLLEKPMHGYQVMTEIEARTGGRWRPSAGSIYPTFQQLEDEGLVRAEEQEGRKVYALTDAGREAAEQSPFSHHPWFEMGGRGQTMDLRKLAIQLAGASMQVSRIGSPEVQQRAAEILVDARRRLYGLLAEDDAESAAQPAEANVSAAIDEEDTSG